MVRIKLYKYLCLKCNSYFLDEKRIKTKNMKCSFCESEALVNPERDNFIKDIKKMSVIEKEKPENKNIKDENLEGKAKNFLNSKKTTFIPSDTLDFRLARALMKPEDLKREK